MVYHSIEKICLDILGMAKTRRYKKKGGKYVSKGTYGCGFYPALLCRENDVRRAGTFSKLTIDVFAKEEFKQFDLLNPIDPTNKYFIYPKHLCDTKNVPDPSNEIEKCHIPLNYSKAKIIQMPEGGVDCAHLKLQIGDIVPFFKSLRNLFIGLFMLHENDINHCDIKPTNVVYQKNIDGTFTTRYIDFGLSFRTTDLPSHAAAGIGNVHSNYFVFNANYEYFNFDVKYANPAHLKPEFFTDKVLYDFYKTVMSQYQTYPAGVFFLSDESFKIGPPEILAKLIYYSGLSLTERHRIIFKQNDIYALGKTLSWIFYHLTSFYDLGVETTMIKSDEPEYNYDEKSEWQTDVVEKIVVPFYEMIRVMVDPINPPPSIYELLEMFDGIEQHFSIYYNKYFLKDYYYNSQKLITILPEPSPVHLNAPEHVAVDVMAGLKHSSANMPGVYMDGGRRRGATMKKPKK